MLFPIGDDNTRRRSFPFINWMLLIGCFTVWFFQLTRGEAFTYALSLVPYELTSTVDLTEPVQVETDEGPFDIPHYPALVPVWATLFTSMFLHGGWMHLLGNMLFLHIFGDQIEDELGHIRYLVFYLGAGAIAGLAHVVTDFSAPVHMVGASGAISGVLGAYLMRYPGNRITVLAFIIPLKLPALLVIGIWFFGQISGYLNPVSDGIAYMAHIGGFLGGIFLINRLGGRSVKNGTD